ncbi:GTPase Der (GTP-binding protein EngA) [Durusdinium trenchii]|uniref:GTPase Der (GTP-binding protein EngA) n=2 Tax=Durusdinium trenchii TaxID=1381693 RepID=A0ABP0P3T4_9DINO
MWALRQGWSSSFFIGKLAASRAPGARQLPLIRSFAMRIPAHRFQREIPEDLEPIPIAIIGRPNVGKSTLFNRLQTGTRKQKKKNPVDNRAIISDRAGTTRDRKDALAVFGGLLLRVIDTGGLETPKETSNSSLLQSMQEHVWKAVAEAQAILFVIDAQEGVTPADEHIGKMLREGAVNADKYRDLFKTNTPREVPIILIANKAEHGFIGPYLNDCYELGVGDPVLMSAKQNQGTEDLYDRLVLEVGHLQQREEEINPGTAFLNHDYMEEGEEEVENDEDIEVDVDDESQPEVPEGPTLPWLSPEMTEHQRTSLRFLAHHPADPLGDLDPGLKAAVLHKDPGKYWLQAPQRALPTKEARDYVLQHRRAEEMDNAMKIALIGSPSSGKSSIINALLQEERCIVDENDGTTMDSIITNWTFKEQPVKLIDTCGVGRKFTYPGFKPEEFMEPGMGTKKAINRAHVCVLCLDASRFRKLAGAGFHCPNKMEVHLGNYVVEEGKCLVIAVNKWDLIHEKDQPKFREEILSRIQEKFGIVKGVPVIFMSAKYNLNLPTLMTRSMALYKRWSARLPTSRLNSWLQAWMLRWPPPWKDGQKCNVKYMTQTRARPPTFVLWTNSTYGNFPENYLRHMRNGMRDEFRISGVPIHFMIRSTCMPKPRKKMTKAEVLKWKRMGPKQAKVAMNLNKKRMPRPLKQID